MTSMIVWREYIWRLALVGDTDLFPLLVFRVEPPSKQDWPESLINSPEILAFYALCNGAYLNHNCFLPLSELEQENKQWQDMLVGEDLGIFDPSNHLILARDCSGFPVGWDKKTGKMFIYFFKEGTWASLPDSFDEFMDQIFLARQDSEMWGEALEQTNTVVPAINWSENSTESALLKVILNEPENNAVRMVYADRLEEQGKLKMAETIRAQVRSIM